MAQAVQVFTHCAVPIGRIALYTANSRMAVYKWFRAIKSGNFGIRYVPHTRNSVSTLAYLAIARFNQHGAVPRNAAWLCDEWYKWLGPDEVLRQLSAESLYPPQWLPVTNPTGAPHELT
jgi:hypothetical protein